MVGTRPGGLRVITLALLTVFVVIPALRAAQGPTPADHLKAGVTFVESGDFLAGLMTLNEVVAALGRAAGRTAEPCP
jgi:hypothetical protein